MKKLINLNKEELVQRLWRAEPRIESILQNSRHVEEGRHVVFDYLDRLRRDLYNMKAGTYYSELNVVEKRNVRECIRVVSNVFRTENEHLTGTSSLELLYSLAHKEEGILDRVSEGFIMEFLALFLGIRGRYGRHSRRHGFLAAGEGKEAALARSGQLDAYASMMNRYLRRHVSGMDEQIVEQRKHMRQAILSHFGGSGKDWYDHRWHLKHIIRDQETLAALVRLEDDEIGGLKMALDNDIPFEITPHYLSLFNRDGRSPQDRAIRAQVIPSVRYCTNVIENRQKGVDMDFMAEKSTSPIEGVTRRYPQIVIIKPYRSCPQICVYCQRNWEVKDMDEEVMLSRKKVAEALHWIRNDRNISEVLVTGGDPLTLNNRYVDWILGEIAAIDHVDRIRIGTRILVTLPFRIDDELLGIFQKYHEWGRREIAVVTHFEHPSEMNPDSLEALRRIRKLGINVYNQAVFTYYNSRKFECAYLRKVLKVCGVDPYYTFNTMGKDETLDFRVPIARIEQERKEECRLLPGLVRTDEPVFNVPRLGKSHLRSWQDHEVIMILPDGRRIYRFYSWETKLTTANDYLYTDVSIYDYLKRLSGDGENVNDYLSIWYYF